MLSPAIASTKIELTKESPKMPPKKKRVANMILTNLPMSSVLFSAICVGISAHPSPVNKRKIVNKDNPGSPKRSGAVLPKMVDDKMEMISNRTEKAIVTIKEAFIAKPIPLSNPLMFGINLSKRNDLKILKDLNERRILVARPVSVNRFNRDGIATKVIMKSNLFQLSPQ